MHFAAQNGHVHAIEALQKAGGSLFAKGVDGWTPMHAAPLVDIGMPSRR